MFIACMFILLIINFISAGVLFSDLNNKYNLGDTIELNVKVDPFFNDRLLKITLFCEGNPVIEFNNLPDEGGNVNIKLPLNFYTIQQANGNCYFSSSYSGETRQSDNFEISKKLIVKLSKDAFFANPGEEIVVSGTATRLNGNPVNGEVEVNVPLLSFLQIESTNETVQINNNSNEEFATTPDINETNSTQTAQPNQTEQPSQEINYESGKFYGEVVNGEFSVSFKLSEETPAGNYRLDLLVFEEDNGIRTSEGVAMATLNIFQVLRRVDLALNNQNFNPGAVLEAKPNLLDQTGVNIYGELSIIIRDESSKRFFEKLVNSKEIFQYNIPTNLTSGYYEILASTNEINSTKKFFVNEKEIASFELINHTLIVSNIGNIPYGKDIEVEMNGKPFIKKVNLNLGETQNFKLSGSGEYNIKVSDGENEISWGDVRLVGYAINVKAVNEKFNLDPIVWILAIIISIVVLLFLFRNFFKKRSLAYHYENRELELREKDMPQSNHPIPSLRESEIEKFKDWKVKEPVRQADQSLVLKGHKSNAAVLVLKIKNRIGNTEKQSLEEAMEYVYDKKGAVYEQDNFIYIVFSPLMTRTNKNEVEAAKAAEKIIGIINEHNKKFREKIDFGIGITSGEIINRVENKKLKFTALSNFIVVGKRLASISDKQILVTKKTYEKGISEIKAEKVKTDAGDVYEVKSIVDHEKSRKFIEGFLERQKKT